MYPVNRILVPTDFSENAATAYGPAQQLARRFGAVIDMVHIIPSAKYLDESAAVLGITLSNQTDRMDTYRKKAEQRLARIMERAIDPEQRGEVLIRVSGNPPAAIAEEAGSGGYDLMIMARKGNHDTQFLRGSITQKVMRLCGIPVFTTGQPALPDIQNILVPTDGSAASLQILPLAATIASAFGASITLLHVVVLQWVTIVNGLRPEKVDLIKESIISEVQDIVAGSGQLQDEGAGEYSIVVDSDGAVQVPVQIVIEEGISVNSSIEAYAADKADITIMATHGRRGMTRLIMGSIAEMASQEIAQPLITARPGYVTEHFSTSTDNVKQKEA